MDNSGAWRLGKTLDTRYDIISVLGIGGMAVVYKAFDSKLKRNVAIKVLRDDVAMDDSARRRFRTEYQAVAMLSHVNIRGVYDVVSSGVTEYIVMEYVDGINLKQYLNRRGVLSWREALHFAAQIARALSHAHSKGILHMDIKPQNIMLSRDGVAKVADFGIAQMENIGGSAAEETVGSIHYISPEQARGETVDARSDIYSLGVVLYEMLTGQLPFSGETLEEVAIKHFAVKPPLPSTLVPGIPHELEEITMKALQPRVEDRYSSADRMLADMDQLRQNMPADTNPQTAQPQDPQQSAAPTAVVTPPSNNAPAARTVYAGRDELHIIKKNVPRISRVGEMSSADYSRRSRRANQISSLLGYAIVICFLLGMFTFLWNFWLRDIFTEAERTNVPDFNGLNAEDLINDESMTDLFDFSIVYQPDADVAEGVVIDQSPTAGSSRMIVESGIKVELVVSAGIEYVTLPDMVNQQASTAQQKLEDLGLKVSVTLQQSTTVAEDNVIKMSPAEGSSVVKGSTVELVISAGSSVTYSTVPNLLGMTKAQALLTLQRNGLSCGESEISYVESDEASTGLVLDQSLPEGSQVISGTQVYLEIGTGPAADTDETPAQ